MPERYATNAAPANPVETFSKLIASSNRTIRASNPNSPNSQLSPIALPTASICTAPSARSA